MCLQNIYKKKVNIIEKYRQKIDFKGKPWGLQAYFLMSYDRSW